MSGARRGRRTYRYLRCETAQKKGTDKCNARTRLPLEQVESLVVDVLRENARTPEFAGRVCAALQGRIDLRREVLTHEADTLPKTLGEASSRVHSFALALPEAPEAAKAVLRRRVDEEAGIVAAQQARLADVQRELRGLVGLEADAAWIERALGRFDAMWDALTDATEEEAGEEGCSEDDREEGGAATCYEANAAVSVEPVAQVARPLDSCG
jgi:hypothetical protein